MHNCVNLPFIDTTNENFILSPMLYASSLH